jgi:hypothetical protein
MSFVLLTLRLTRPGIPSRVTLSKFSTTIAMSSMKFALHWKRPKKGYSSFQKAVFYRQEDVIWYINVLKEQGIEDYDILPVFN